MKYEFTDDDLKNGINEVYFDEDELLLKGEYIEKREDFYVLVGTCIVENETYHNFEVGFNTVSPLTDITAKNLMLSEWEYYEYLFETL